MNDIDELLKAEHTKAKRGVTFSMRCHAEGCDKPASDPLPFCYGCWVRIPVDLKMDFFLDTVGDYSSVLTARPDWIAFMKDAIAAIAMRNEGF